ncbi:hypothetical protein DAKH74_031660 [Maudiozyma humilis]|uniref:Uncharacterized protein n=1 Tax=Maudiozyma humilis TaxID=51915 RepID=A0AAV5RYP7_MAUHU|nr:hypothetical protein DAKH74_031660 [Kazachstania humilis]
MNSTDPRLQDIYNQAKKYIPLIDQIYNGTSAGISEAEILGDMLRILNELPPDFHMFCDPIIEPLSIFSLTLFSFNEQKDAYWLKNRYNPILSKCEKCILHFSRGKCKMLQHFAIQRKVSHHQVSSFNDIVCQWRVESIAPTLKSLSSNEDKTSIIITQAIRCVIYEGLCNPQMFRLNSEFKELYNIIFKYLFDTKYPLLNIADANSLNIILPGLIYCWSEGSIEQNTWARGYLQKLLAADTQLTKESLTADVVEEIAFHILNLQNPANWNSNLIAKFWHKMLPIFALLDQGAFEEYFIVPKNIESLQKSINFTYNSIFKLWFDHFALPSPNKPLDFLLRALNLFLVKFDLKFWQLISPYMFRGVLDIIFEKNLFVRKLAQIQNNRIPNNDIETYLSPEGSMTDLMSWTLPFYKSLSVSQRIQMVKQVSVSFLRIIANFPDLKVVPKACLMNSSTALLPAGLTVKEKDRALLYVSDKFETTILTMSDSRMLLNNPLIQDIVIKSATDASTIYPGLGQVALSVSRSAMLVLSKCIDIDILRLCQRSYHLYTGKTISETPLPLTLIENLNKCMHLNSLQDGPLLAEYLLVSLRNINGLLIIQGNSPVIIQHNEIVKKFLEQVTQLIEKFTDILPDKLSEILSDKRASEGFWSCIFSSDAHLYQATTNILYDTFDVEGRLEGIQTILTKNMAYQVRSINIVLSQLIKCEFYEPCPRAVRVIMDILSAFTDPINGILSNYASLKGDDTDKEIVSFWELSWSFLDTIYRCTLKWAARYDYSELENFTKDTLELSRSFVNSFREFSDAITLPGIDLFQNVSNTFRNMLYWLRLSDDELLESCVRLIISASDLAYERGISFDDDLIENMARYAAKAKKFSNKLTDQQTTEILNKASLFNKGLVDTIVKTVETEKLNKELQKQRMSEVKTARLPGLRESKADFLQRKAASSSILGRPKASQPKITSFGVFKPGNEMEIHNKKLQKPLSRMELARRQILNSRVVHSASTSVFHTKSKTPAKSEDSSSGESDVEGDIESARELFATSKAKGKTIETLDINGKKIKKNSRAEQAKIDEENMRRRLNVDLNALYGTILKWDYTRKNEYPDDHNENYTDMKDTFKSAAEYRKIVKPLLLLECWQGLCAARDRVDNNPFSMIIGNRTAISDFYEVYASMPKSLVENSKMMESDLIALAYFPDLSPGQRLSSDSFRNAEHTCLAKIRSIKFAKNNNVDLTLRIHRDHSFSKFLILRSEIHAIKVMQMTTVEREFQTLEALEYYDLLNQILTAKPTTPGHISPEEINSVQRNYKLNPSQAEAIINTVLNEGFSLIQGPPGTGKTKTILGIIGYFLSIKKLNPVNAIQVPGEQSNKNIDQLLKKQKVLICAPSNAAVDEICIRLKEGVYDKNGVLSKPKVVRVGRSDVVNVAIKELTLEELVDRKLSANTHEMVQNPELEKKFNTAVTKRRALRDKLNSENGMPQSKLSTEDIEKLQAEIRELSRELNTLGRERDELREKNSLTYRRRNIDKRNAQAHILAESDVICSTLSGSAHDVLATLGIRFDTVVIDEACQCTELSSMIPLRYGAKRCIMVGDPNQLPPTVLSGAASNFKYNQSLFVRMEKNITPYLLNVQYRMHPDISRFPSREFYNGRLLDGPNMDVINKRPWHSTEPLQPYKFFDISTGRQQQNTKTMSYVNVEESRVAMELVKYLFDKYERQVDFTGKIGVISPYKEQMLKMRRDFTSYFGSFINKFIDFNTIDGFQGQEKEIIIISCVRADDTKTSVGFLKDFRRMNVAFTRAKTSLWILGHRNSLYQNKLWRNLIDDAESRHCVQKAYSGFLNNFQPSAPVPSIVEENDSYNPLETTSHLSKKRPLSEPSPTHQPLKKEKKEKKDKKDKKDKREKKDKKEKRDKKSKSITEDDGGKSSGTKRKSSFFGPTSSSSEPKVATKGVYINDDKERSHRKLLKQKNSRHVSYADNVTIIHSTNTINKLLPSKNCVPPIKGSLKKQVDDTSDNGSASKPTNMDDAMVNVSHTKLDMALQRADIDNVGYRKRQKDRYTESLAKSRTQNPEDTKNIPAVPSRESNVKAIPLSTHNTTQGNITEINKQNKENTTPADISNNGQPIAPKSTSISPTSNGSNATSHPASASVVTSRPDSRYNNAPNLHTTEYLGGSKINKEDNKVPNLSNTESLVGSNVSREYNSANNLDNTETIDSPNRPSRYNGTTQPSVSNVHESSDGYIPHAPTSSRYGSNTSRYNAGGSNAALSNSKNVNQGRYGGNQPKFNKNQKRSQSANDDYIPTLSSSPHPANNNAQNASSHGNARHSTPLPCAPSRYNRRNAPANPFIRKRRPYK